MERIPVPPSAGGHRFIALNGFMGSGKSSVGKLLAAALGCRLIDLDSFIEDKSGRSIPEIFASDGEAAFRNMEREALEQILGSDDGQEKTIVSLGGGTVTTPECAETVKDRMFCIYLRARTGTLLENLRKDFSNRPMLAKDGSGPRDAEVLRTRIEELMDARGSIYENTAALTVDIDGRNFADIAEELADLLR